MFVILALGLTGMVNAQTEKSDKLTTEQKADKLTERMKKLKLLDSQSTQDQSQMISKEEIFEEFYL